MASSLLDSLKQRVSAGLGWLAHRHRAAKQEKSAPHVDADQLTMDLRRLGVAPGDTLFVHSSLRSLGFVEGGPAAVIAALRQAVGSEGTLLLPTYYLPGGTIGATCELTDYTFDPRMHGTHMGALPAAFLTTPGVLRSVHPTHSVSALGRLARQLTDGHQHAPSVFGRGSPWDRFVEAPQAKVLGLGISMGPVTFYHMLEDRFGDAFPLPVWASKSYAMPCIDYDGRTCTVPVRPFDPVLTARRIDQKARGDLRDYFAAEFERVGLKTNGLVGQARSWLIPGPGFLDHLQLLAAEGITIYATADELAARPLPSDHAAPSQ